MLDAARHSSVRARARARVRVRERERERASERARAHPRAFLLHDPGSVLFLGLLQLVFGGDMLMTMRISLGLVVFCGYLVYNTQMMMGGKKNGRQIRPNEHIMAVGGGRHSETVLSVVSL